MLRFYVTFSFLPERSQTRHGGGVSSYMTNLSDNQASEIKTEQKQNKTPWSQRVCLKPLYNSIHSLRTRPRINMFQPYYFDFTHFVSQSMIFAHEAAWYLEGTRLRVLRICGSIVFPNVFPPPPP